MRRNRFVRQYQWHRGLTLDLGTRRPTMSRPIITSDNLGKHYHLGVLRRKSLRSGTGFTFRETLSKTLNSGLRLLRGGKLAADHRESSFWALRNASFEVQRGEVVGLIGRNGAGKSSTMRMIGCVSPPTSGELTILGRDPVKDGSAIRGRLGVVPQEDTLDVELIVRENLLVYGRYFGLPRRVIRDRRGPVPTNRAQNSVVSEGGLWS